MAENQKKLLDIATNEIGYLEKKSNSCLDDKKANAGTGNYTRYWRDIYPSFQGQAWCLCFVIWCFVKAYGTDVAKQLLLMNKGFTYYTPDAAKAFNAVGRLYTTPQPGDLIFFRSDACEKQGRWRGVHHVGIVESVCGNTVTTIEGNTDAGQEVIPNGGGVWRKQYTYPSNTIAGFARPNWDIIAPPADGWKQENNKWYYYRGGDKIHNEWLLYKHYWYRLGNDGEMLTDWHQIDDNGTLRWAYFDSEGRMWHEDHSDDRGFLVPYYVD